MSQLEILEFQKEIFEVSKPPRITERFQSLFDVCLVPELYILEISDVLIKRFEITGSQHVWIAEPKSIEKGVLLH